MGTQRKAPGRRLPVHAFRYLVMTAFFPAAGVVSAAAPAGTGGCLVVENSSAAGMTVVYEAPPVELRLLVRGSDEFLLPVLREHRSTRADGGPSLPVLGAAVAIPEGASARLSYEIVRRSPLSATRVPLAAMNSGAWEGPGSGPAGPAPATDPVTFEETGRLRHHRVGQLSIRPVEMSETGDLVLDESIRIHITFFPGAFRAGALEPVGEEPAWEETYRRVLLNYEAARRFRMRPAPRASRPTAAPRFPAAAVHPEARILVGTTGLYAIAPSDLAALGFPPDLPVPSIRLYEKDVGADDPSHPSERPVPVHVEESGGTPGVFDGDDRILFYGMNRVDRFRLGFREARFSHLHTYWLTWGGGSAARMDSASGWTDAGTFETPVSFTDAKRYEQDVLYAFDIPSQAPGDFPDTDTHYWLRPSLERDSLEFETPDPDPAGACRIRARWQGTSLTTHYVGLLLSRGCSGGLSTRLLYRQPFFLSGTYVYDSGSTLAASVLAPGCNRLVLEGNGIFASDPDSPGSGAWFDWFDVAWSRRYVVRDGRLRFTSGAARGPVEIVLTGLRSEVPFVCDVTDSLHPRIVDLSRATITSLGGRPPEYEIRFRPDPVLGQRTWILHEPDAIPSIRNAAPALPPDLGPANPVLDASGDAAADDGSDVLVLTHASLRAAIQPWVDFRNSRGHRLKVVTTQDVWNEFSGGDKSVPAIRSWLRWVYRNWSRPPDDLVLFGDASEDYRKALAGSDPDWVPTMMLYGPVPAGSNRFELVGSDNYYVGSLAVGDVDRDLYPEMHVGRLPAGTPAEASALIEKIVAYETRGEGEAWRHRGLLMSDDQYSTSYLGNADYCWAPDEAEFEKGSDSLRLVLTRDPCGSPFQVETFRLSDYLDSVPALGRHPGPNDCPDPVVNRTYTKEHVTPEWLSRASEGHLFLIYSGHGSRIALTDETLVEFNGFFTTPGSRTPELLTNYGRPFIFIGASCHLNEYEYFEEKDSESSIGEEMLLLPGRGAIASIASTGFEYTGTNLPVEYYLGKTLFSDPLVDPSTGRAGRLLGVGFDEALVRMSAAMGGGPGETNLYRNTLVSYCLLGDPLLRIDRSLPAIEVRADGVRVEPGGTVTASPGLSTVNLSARLTDDTDTGAIEIVEDSLLVPPDRYVVRPIPDAGDSCHGALLAFTPTIAPATYDIVLHVRDWLGQAVAFPLRVVLGVEYRIDGRRIASGDLVPGSGHLEVGITSPVRLEPGRLSVRVNGDRAAFPLETGDAAGRVWAGSGDIVVRPGPVTLEALLDGAPVRAAGGRISVVAVPGVTLRNVAFYPNPWEGHGGGRFLYEIGRPAGRGEDGPVTIQIFSVSGRKVRTLSGSAQTGRNEIAWDMRDGRGDPLANGVYLYKLSLAGRETSPVIDRLVIHR